MRPPGGSVQFPATRPREWGCSEGQSCGGARRCEQQIPCGNDRKKSKDKCRSFDCALRAPLRMTELRGSRLFVGVFSAEAVGEEAVADPGFGLDVLLAGI